MKHAIQIHDILTHSKYEMTQRYAHLSKSHVAAGAMILDGALAGTLGKALDVQMAANARPKLVQIGITNNGNNC